MGYVSPCHVYGLEHLYPGRNLHLPTPIISPSSSFSPHFPRVLLPSTDCNLCHRQCFRAQPDTSAMLDTLFSTKFPLGFQGRPGPEMSQQEGLKHPLFPRQPSMLLPSKSVWLMRRVVLWGVMRLEEAPSVLFHPSSYPAATPALITCNSSQKSCQGEPALAQDTHCVFLFLRIQIMQIHSLDWQMQQLVQLI